MPDRLVFDTGPLITLARIDCLDVVSQLPYEFFCPEAVRRELTEGVAAGHPRVALDWITVRTSRVVRPFGAALALGEGEASVIELTLSMGNGIAVIDEWKGRRAARAVGLEITGSLGLLGQAKFRGLVPELGPLIERALSEGIRFHPDLVRSVLEAVGE